MDTILISLPIKTAYLDYMESDMKYNPPLGLLSIASYLNVFGFKAEICDYNTKIFDLQLLIETIHENNLLLVAITVYTENFSQVLRMASQLKRGCQDLKIAVGGPHATIMPQELVNSCYIDYVTIGDAESEYLELLTALKYPELGIDINMIPGVMTKENKSNRMIPERLPELDLLPVINRHLVEIDRFDDTINMYTSKGCPANCIYCAATAISGAKYRMKSVEAIFLEIMLLQSTLKKDIQYYFIDDTFTAVPERVFKFTELLKKSGVSIQWMCESRVDVMTEEMLDEMHKTGCRSLQFGVESGNQMVIDKIRKKIKLSDIEHFVKYSSKYDIEIYLSFMIGHFCDTIETMNDTYNFMVKMWGLNHNLRIAVSYNTPMPGTWQFTHSDDIGFTYLSENYSDYDLITPIVVTDNFSQIELESMYDKITKFIGYTQNYDKSKDD